MLSPRLTKGAVEALFRGPHPLIGVLHLPPLPGSPSYDGCPMKRIIEGVLVDAARMAGFAGLIVENAGDLPYVPEGLLGPETASCMAVILSRVTAEVECPVGVICLSNAVRTAIAIAVAGGGKFVRANLWTGGYVADAGIIESPAGGAMRYRRALGADRVVVLADVHVKHGAHAITADRSVGDQAKDAEYFGADVLIATGSRTGDATRKEEVEAIKDATSLPVFIGSGLDPSNCESLLSVADGAIVGSFLREQGKWWLPIDVERVRALRDAVRALASVDGIVGEVGR